MPELSPARRDPPVLLRARLDYVADWFQPRRPQVGPVRVRALDADRTATIEQQAHRRLADLAVGLPVRPVAAVRASRGTSRLFLVSAATAAHARYLTERLTGLERSPWSAELLVYWPG